MHFKTKLLMEICFKPPVKLRLMVTKQSTITERFQNQTFFGFKLLNNPFLYFVYVIPPYTTDALLQQLQNSRSYIKSDVLHKMMAKPLCSYKLVLGLRSCTDIKIACYKWPTAISSCGKPV